YRDREMTLTADTFLYEYFATAQCPKHRDVPLAGEIGRQALDPLLKLTDLSDQSDSEDQVGEDRPQNHDTKPITSDGSFPLHITTLLRPLGILPPDESQRAAS